MARMRDSRTSSSGFSTAIEPSGKCRKYSLYVLLGTNAVLMFFSVAFFGIGIYRVTLCSFLDPLAAECDVTKTLEGGLFRHFSDVGTAGLLIAGAFLFLVACLGFIAISCKSKILMAFYTGFVMILIIALGASSILLLAYGGVIPNDTISRFITDLQGSIFDECCFEAGFVDDGAPLCEDVQNVTDICLDQEIDIDDAICEFLETFEVEDVDGFPVPLVGNTTLGGCGGDEGFEGFVDQFLALTITDVLIGFAAAEMVCVGIFICTFVAAWVFLCSSKDPPQRQTTSLQASVPAHSLSNGTPLYGNPNNYI